MIISKGVPVKLNERLASLETEVRVGNLRASEDRADVKQAFEDSQKELKNLLGGIGLRLDLHDEQLVKHNELIAQTRAVSKVLTWIWGFLLAAWGALEGYFHTGGRGGNH